MDDMRRAYSLLISFAPLRISPIGAFVVIGVLSLAVGLWIPGDGGALPAAWATVTGVAVGLFVLSDAYRRHPPLGATGLAPVMKPLRSRAYLVPRELPPAPSDFVGRTAELKRLEETVRRSGDAGPFIAVIYGAPGIGKSALAVTFAHKVAPFFPAGHLFLPQRAGARQAGRATGLVA